VEYEVIVDDLYGYGIYASRDTKAIGWITLIPGVGIGGSEVAFRRHVPKGQAIRILSAWRQPLLFDNGVYYRVTIDGLDFPSTRHNDYGGHLSDDFCDQTLHRKQTGGCFTNS